MGTDRWFRDVVVQLRNLLSSPRYRRNGFKSWRLLWLTLSSIVNILHSGQAVADDVEPLVSAKNAYDEGVLLSKRGDLEAALGSFERAYRLGRHPAALYNLGQLQYLLGLTLQAKETLERYVNEAQSGDEAERRRNARQTLQQLLRRVGTIRVDVDPPNARVLVDGMVLDGNKRLMQVLVGSHSIIASSDGYGDEHRLIEVGAEQSAAIELRLVRKSPESGWIKAHCSVPEVTVQVGDTTVSADQLKQPLRVPSGAQVVRFARAGYVSNSQAIFVPLGQLAEVDCALRAVSDLQLQDNGWLTIRALPAGAEISVDGLPLSQSALPTGLHRVEVRLPGYQTWTKEVRIFNQREVAFDVELVPTPSTRATRSDQSRRERTIAYTVGAGGLVFGVGALAAYWWNSKRHDRWQRDRDEISQGQTSASAWAALADRSASIQRVDDLALASAVVGTALLSTSVYLLVKGQDSTPPSARRPGWQAASLGRMWQW